MSGGLKAEYAKSGRASCKACYQKIAKDKLRLGKMVAMENVEHYVPNEIPHWYHVKCFFTAHEKKPGFARFAGAKNLKAADQNMLYKEINGCNMPKVKMKVAEDKEVEHEAKAVEEAAAEEQRKKEPPVLKEDLQLIVGEYMAAQLDKMTIADLKELMNSTGIHANGKKAELVNAIVVKTDLENQDLSEIAYKGLTKLTIPQLKDVLKSNKLPVGGTKSELAWRILEQVGGIRPPPPPSEEDLGPDYDMIFDEWQNVHPDARLKTNGDLDRLLSTPTVIKSVEFDRDYNVEDDDVEKLVTSKGFDLVNLEMGNSDTGCGTRLTSYAASLIAESCPKLQKLRLDSCRCIDDKVAINIGEKCHRLRYLFISGHDRSHGALKDRFIDKLTRDKEFLPRLVYLNVYDQGCDYMKLEKLGKVRRHLRIEHGDTERDHPFFYSNFGMAGTFTINGS